MAASLPAAKCEGNARDKQYKAVTEKTLRTEARHRAGFVSATKVNGTKIQLRIFEVWYRTNTRGRRPQVPLFYGPVTIGNSTKLACPGAWYTRCVALR